MLAPSGLVTTGPAVARPAASRRVVVVLPLVPETGAIRRPSARWAMASLSSLSPTWPPMTEPPRPSRRDTPPLARTAAATRRTRVAVPGGG